jgi:hypothetical protein
MVPNALTYGDRGQPWLQRIKVAELTYLFSRQQVCVLHRVFSRVAPQRPTDRQQPRRDHGKDGV